MDKKLVENIRYSIALFSKSTDIPVALIDNDGKTLFRIGQSCEYCDLIGQTEKGAEKCAEAHLESSIFSASLGECYFFECHGKMLHFAIAVMNGKKVLGSILAGPVLADFPDISTIDSIISEFDMPKTYRSIILSSMREVSIISPKKLDPLGKLLYTLVYSTLPDAAESIMKENRQRENRSKVIANAIASVPHDLKDINSQRVVQGHQEQQLSNAIEHGDIETAQMLLNDIIGGIYFSTGTDIELIKIRVSELITVLTRRMYERGITSDKLFDSVNQFQKITAKTDSISDISIHLSDLLHTLVDMMAADIHGTSSPEICSALDYIHKNYCQDITQEDVAAHISISPNYFSKKFKSETGVGFSRYLTGLRIEKSCDLMRTGVLELSEIAQLSGFSNQQYFTKVFFKIKGMTPGEYRKSIGKNV